MSAQPRTLVYEELVAALATHAAISEGAAADFIKAFFNSAAQAISTHHTLNIDSLGRFIASEQSGDVAFTPTEDVAALANAPFEMFEAVELSEGVNAADLNLDGAAATEVDITAQLPADTPAQPAAEALKAPVAPPPYHPAAPQQPEVQQQPEMPCAPREPEFTAPQAPQPQPEPQVIESTVYVRRGCPWWLVAILVALAAVAGFLWARMLADSANAIEEITEQIAEDIEDDFVTVPDTVSPVDTDEAAAAEEIAAPAEAPAAAPTEHLDTVRVKYYITHMAKRYYGNDNFWSYIYKENEDKLGNPDLTQPGTVVVIPPAEKYGIDANNPESVRAAKQLGAEIYKPYRR